MKHAHVTETLTQVELAAVFELSGEDFNPVEKPSRVLFECDGATWTERDPVTGRVISTGTVGDL